MRSMAARYAAIVSYSSWIRSLSTSTVRLTRAWRASSDSTWGRMRGLSSASLTRETARASFAARAGIVAGSDDGSRADGRAVEARDRDLLALRLELVAQARELALDLVVDALLVVVEARG